MNLASAPIPVLYLPFDLFFSHDFTFYLDYNASFLLEIYLPSHVFPWPIPFGFLLYMRPRHKGQVSGLADHDSSRKCLTIHSFLSNIPLFSLELGLKMNALYLVVVDSKNFIQRSKLARRVIDLCDYVLLLPFFCLFKLPSCIDVSRCNASANFTRKLLQASPASMISETSDSSVLQVCANHNRLLLCTFSFDFFSDLVYSCQNFSYFLIFH